jgi:excisionase family DNA binding protein
MDAIFKALSKRERATHAKLQARLEQSEQSAPQLTAVKPAPRRAHRVKHRYENRDNDAAPDSDSLAFCVEDAARLIGVSRATLYVLISEGDLRTLKIRKRRLVPRDALLELLATAARED